MSDHRTEAETGFEHGMAAAEPVEIGGRKCYRMPNSMTFLDTEKLLPAPLANKGTTTLDRVESFVDFVNLMKSDPARLFITCDGRGFPSFAALFDPATKDDTSWQRHRATFDASMSKQLLAWVERDVMMGEPAKFADFLERRRSDIIHPDPATLLDMIRDLRGSASVDFSEVTDAKTGAKSVAYAERIKVEAGDKSLELPAMFRIAIPIYERQAVRIPVNCHLRLEVKEGKFKLRYELDLIDEIIEEVCDQLVDDTAKAIDLAPFYGSPK